MKRIYLSGAMTGCPDLNFPAFHAAAKALRERGLVVINPAEIKPEGERPAEAGKPQEPCAMGARDAIGR